MSDVDPLDPYEPFKDDPDRRKDVTVGMIKEMLKDIPDDYTISFDSALGHVVKGDFTIYPRSKKISING
jgi:hypothetical protein